MSDMQLPGLNMLSGLGASAAGQFEEEEREDEFDMDAASTYAVLEEALTGKTKASPEAILHIGNLYSLDSDLLAVIQNPNEYSKKEFDDARKKLVEMARLKLKDQSSQIKKNAPKTEEEPSEDIPVKGPPPIL